MSLLAGDNHSLLVYIDYKNVLSLTVDNFGAFRGEVTGRFASWSRNIVTSGLKLGAARTVGLTYLSSNGTIGHFLLVL